MSKANEILEYLVEKCHGLFPDKKVLFNPYSIETNNELRLVDGFGVGFGAITNPEFISGCIRINQDFIIPISRKFYALENDSEKRQDHEQILMEEATKLIKAITKDVQLGGHATRSAFTGSPGIQQVFSESQQYIYLTLTFNASFKENL